ncbi:predicted protein [Lichtheimia corymbifera JMRC:FSU:9682]|uniref:Uncharacterized protein n=1 Tax=Lichtheimia corymbifera JMRC:FSU:9682 TaxID=1263082 RepID=A0A068RPV9_9FUNG|nr:predicted protein [Lichtheimia corymbifera JMRC:FSU:9682]
MITAHPDRASQVGGGRQQRFKPSRFKHHGQATSPSEGFPAAAAPRLHRRRPYREDGTLYTNDFGDGNKDRFMELAQAALEEATLEDERKGLIYEVVEALIAKSGAPLVAEVISEQLRSQEIIEQLAESHEEEKLKQQQQQEQKEDGDEQEKQKVFAPGLLKEPPDAVLQVDDDDDGQVGNRRWLISEYIWRLFRILLLASFVGLVYHFMCAYHQDLF